MPVDNIPPRAEQDISWAELTPEAQEILDTANREFIEAKNTFKEKAANLHAVCVVATGAAKYKIDRTGENVRVGNG